MKKSFKNRSAVSPVIATILMVAITVVLAAVLYVMVMGFGGTSSSAPSGAIAASEKLSAQDLKFTFGAFSKETQFTDCKLIIGLDGALSDAEVIAFGTTDSQAFTVAATDDYTVSYFDLADDGKISQGDYITLSLTAANTDLPEGEYTVTLLWAQDGSTIDSSSITV